MPDFSPRRIVCLTEETVETLYLLGAADRIVGVTGYAVRPPQVRKEKPRVGAFTSADVPAILALEPDLVLTFSDLQADIAADLIRAGVAVHGFNQRDIGGTLAMIQTLGALVNRQAEAAALIDGLSQRIAWLLEHPPAHRTRVYVEEWDDPRIAGIGWVSELVEIAGGIDVFADRAQAKAAKDRFVTDAEIIDRAPDVIIASWCGKKVRAERITSRPGWDTVPAVQSGRIVEIKAPLILAPGPAALTDGLDAVLAALGRDPALGRPATLEPAP